VYVHSRKTSGIAPMFYGEPDRCADVMLHAIGLNGSFFNSHPMPEDYVSKAYAVEQEPR
jgi:starch phosphorylase